MKRFIKWIALLAMMTLLLGGLTGCGGSDGGEASAAPEESSNAVSGNWYLIEDGDITTLKLDANGGGSLAGKPVSYTLSDDETSLSLTVSDVTSDLSIEEDATYGTVLKSDGTLYALRDKETAKAAVGNAGPDYSEALVDTWYMPMDGVMQTLIFDADGKVDYNGVATIDYELSGDQVTLIYGSDTLNLQIAEDSIDGWILKDVSTGDTLAWKSETTATVQGMADMWEEEGKKESASTKENDYIGVWDAEKFTYNGQEFTTEQAGMTFSVEINKDGTATATTNGEPDGEGTWTLNEDGTLSLVSGSDNLDPFSIDGDGYLHVVLQSDDGEIVFYCKKR